MESSKTNEAFWAEGDLVEARERGTDEHDTGRVVAVRFDAAGHEIVTVAWDSQVTTDVDVDDERSQRLINLRGISSVERNRIRFAAEEV